MIAVCQKVPKYMMLVESRFCQHPPLWTCARCGGCDSSRSGLFSNATRGFKTHCSGKEGLKLSKYDRDDHLDRVAGALPENSASSAIPLRTSSVEQFAGTLKKAAPSLPVEDQPLWLLEYSGPSIDQLDSIEIRDEDPWSSQSGPFPGDLAEVEAFCRIFRIAEQVHNVIMDSLRFVNDARGQPVVESDEIAFENDFESNGVPLLEEKVVSGLGCIGALLHQQKQEVLGGRFNHGSSSLSRQEHTPPLAHFRAALKKCCEQLEIALLCYFPADDVQFAGMHSRFQKLKNVCFDIGYPRTEGSPSHADIPNWGAVRLWTPRGDRTPEADNEVMFWKGGQVTGEGVCWLVDNGFKVMVDLRAEGSADHLAKSALNDAVLTGKLRVIKLPVEQGKSPTKDQVLEFAKLVAEPESHPLYLQSQEGIGRTSLLAARWREIVIRNARGAIKDSSIKKHLFDEVDAFFQHENDNLECVNESGLDIQSKGESGMIDNEVFDHSFKEASLGEQMVSEDKSPMLATPFETQRPAVNFFSKQAMSKFLKGRQVTPARFRWRKESAKLERADSCHGEDSSSSITIEDPAGRWGLDGPGIPRAGKREDGFIPVISAENSSAQMMPSLEDADMGDTFEEKKVDPPTNGASFPVKSEDNYTKRGLFRFGGAESAVDEAEEPAVVGDMCASTTGVVRLQSRKKAEMYLVRTDGFSCTREKVKESTLAFTHPSTQQQMLMWKTAPKTVLLLKKLGDELMQEAQQVASFLHYREGMNVIVEPEVHDRFARVSGFGFVQTFYNQDTSDLHERVDFVVCLGGDGVILHASNLFRNAVPPVVSFNLGSLGFLTAHPFEEFMQDLSAIIHGNNRVEGVYITLRMRLHCELFRNGKSVPGKVFDVLNEVVVDRGSNPYLCKIECYERNRLITKVQADGVIVATPTGSTAYSTAAGGSMVHPNVPCMLFTPICPHSLSFRPVILPDSALLELKVPEDARSNAWVSFDGKRRQQLSRGDSVRVCMSEHPLPTVNKSDQTDDWFQSLVRCLNWNERLEQKALPASSR